MLPDKDDCAEICVNSYYHEQTPSKTRCFAQGCTKQVIAHISSQVKTNSVYYATHKIKNPLIRIQYFSFLSI